MNIQAEKIQLAKMILDIDNPKIILSIKKILKKEKPVDFWDELSLNQQKEIKKGIEDIEVGNTVAYESFIKKYR